MLIFRPTYVFLMERFQNIRKLMVGIDKGEKAIKKSQFLIKDFRIVFKLGELLNT